MGIAGMKMECESDLAEAMPILNEALAALDTIKDADIQYIKKLGNPPALIKLVMEVSLLLASSSALSSCLPKAWTGHSNHILACQPSAGCVRLP